MPLNVELIVTIIAKLAPTLYEPAFNAFFGEAMQPSPADAKILRTYLGTLKNRDVLNVRVQDTHWDPVLGSLNEIRRDAYRFIGELHEFPRGQVMVEAILDACKDFLRKWGQFRGQGFTTTFAGEPSDAQVANPPTGWRGSPLSAAFSQDLLELRSNVNILRDGIEEILKSGAPAWGGIVQGDVGKAIVQAAVDSLVP